MKFNQISKVLLLLVFTNFFLLLSAEDRPREGAHFRDITRVMKLVFYNHYNRQLMTPEIARKTMINYLSKELDYQNLYLLRSDFDKYSNEYKKVLDAYSAKRGTGEEWYFIEEIHSLFKKRYAAVMEHSFEYLKNVKEVDQTLSIIDKAEERGFPLDEAQSKKWIETYIQYNIAYLTQSKKYTFEDACKKLLQERMRNYEKRMKKDTYDTARYFINSFNASVDPHSYYYSPEDYKEFNEDMRLSFEGIGARLLRDEVSGVSMIVDIIKDGPAFHSGLLKKFDEILGVKEIDSDEFKPVVGMELGDIVRLIKGPKGSEVVLQVRRSIDDVVEVLPIPIKRGKVKTDDEEAVLYYETVVDKDSKKELLIGIIELPSFYRDFEGFSSGDKAAKSCAADVQRLLEQAKLKKVNGIIFDLQNNSGGSLTDAISIVGLFINKGAVVVTKDNKGKEHIRNDPDGDISYEGPLIVLINKKSASASEIVSGALKDYRRALILGGERTFGKGTVQEIYSLGQDRQNKELGAIKITINQFFTAGGSSTQWEGVSSDICLPSYFDSVEVGEKEYKEALPFEKISSYVDDRKAGGSWSRVTSEVIEALKANTLRRVAASKEFQKIKSNVEKSKAKQAEEKVLKVSEFFNKNKEDEDLDEFPEEFPIAWFRLLTSKDRYELYKKVKSMNIFPSKNFGIEEDSSEYLVDCFSQLLQKKNLNDLLPRDVKHGSSIDSQRLVKEINTFVSKEGFDQKSLLALNKKLLRSYYPELKGPYQNSIFIKEGLSIMADLIEISNKEIAKANQSDTDK